MSVKLFVGGVSWNATDASLHEAFSEFGEVTDAKIITDRETGKSRGFGFVTFKSPADAANALDAMNGSTLDGRTITVNEAAVKPRNGGDDRGSRPGPNGPRNDMRGPSSRNPSGSEPEITRRPSSARREEPNERDHGEGMSPPKSKNRKSSTPPPESMFVERVTRAPVREARDWGDTSGGTDDDRG
jgi:RNA recognition motif-containing protein